jgi:transcriptional regulator with XRE-family HTH domain
MSRELVLHLRSPLGLALERYRFSKGLGVNELARLANVDPAQISRLEGGHQVSAHASTLRKLAEALEVDADHLARLNALSRVRRWTTGDEPQLVAEDARQAPYDIETLIEIDPTIPKKRKKWLRECVALARK